MINKLFIILFCLLFLFGCKNNKEFLIKEIDFSQYKGISFNANDILVEDNSNKDIKPPYIDHLILNNINSYMSKWIKARINTNLENKNLVKIKIMKANAKAFPLNSDNKLEEIFVNKAAVRIELDI